MKERHLLLIRTSGSILNLNTYNCQELGLAKTLVQKGYKVSLVLAGDNDSNEVLDGVSVYYCSFKALNQQLAWFCNIDNLLTSLKPDLIQVHDMGLFMTWRVIKWAKKHLVPSVLIQGNYQTTQKPLLKQFEQLYNLTFGRGVLRNVDAIGCKTMMAANYIHQYTTKPTVLTYIGLDDSKFQNALTIDWRSKLHIGDKYVLLYIGSLESRRNPLFLVDVVKHLSNDYVLLMAGSGPLENQLLERIEKENITDRCFLLGKLKQNEIPSLYQIADSFLLASNYEIYGMVLLEAMYFGVPIVSSWTAGSETLVEEGKSGYIVSDFNTDKWIEKIKLICDNPVLKAEMSKFSSNKAKSELVWNKAVDRFIDLYKSVL